MATQRRQVRFRTVQITALKRKSSVEAVYSCHNTNKHTGIRISTPGTNALRKCLAYSGIKGGVLESQAFRTIWRQEDVCSR